MIHTDKIKYKVLISDDNPLFVKRLTPKISEINYHNMLYSIDIDTCLSPDACIENLKNNIYDIIILDVCRSRSNEYTQTNSDFLRESVQPDYCGIDLYEEAVKHNPSAKIFILSNLKVYDIRTLFNNAEAEYFSKNQNVEIEIAMYFDSLFNKEDYLGLIDSLLEFAADPDITFNDLSNVILHLCFYKGYTA